MSQPTASRSPADRGPRSAGAVAGRDLVVAGHALGGRLGDLAGREGVAGVLVGDRGGEDDPDDLARRARRSGRRSCPGGPGRAASRPRGSPCRRRRCRGSAAAAGRGSGRAGRRRGRPRGSRGSRRVALLGRLLGIVERQDRSEPLSKASIAMSSSGVVLDDGRRRPCRRRPRSRGRRRRRRRARWSSAACRRGEKRKPEPSTPRPQSLVPRTLSTESPARIDVGVAQDPLVARLDLDDLLRRERLEVAREERRPDDVVERVSTLPAPVGSDVVDLGEHRRAAHHRGDALDPGAGDRRRPAPRPRSSTAAALRTAPPTASSARTGCQRDLVAQPGAEELAQALAQRRRQDHDEQRAERDQQRRVGVAERDRRQPDAEADRRPAARRWRRRR